ncbi:MAG: beta-propeller domain-containing protein [Clostridia bacterium]|nr:beta-propeller domain-containing protein [Clostridia bacterium]
MTKKIQLAIGVIFIIIITTIAFLFLVNDNSELRTIKSERELEKFYQGYEYSDAKELFINIITMPFSLISGGVNYYTPRYYNSGIIDYEDAITTKSKSPSTSNGLRPAEITSQATSADSSKSSITDNLIPKKSKDYSTTNIQVENVDEADITKTDGDYIYSISEDNVIITNVQDPQNIKIEATINSTGGIPEDLILYEDKLVVISATGNYASTYSYSYNAKTNVDIYDISNREYPEMIKSFELHEPYYTSRCINSELYIISSGKLRKENDKIDRKYSENRIEKEIPLKHIKYLKDIDTEVQTLIATTDLNNSQQDIELSSYLIDISNAYVSENSIYLLNQEYAYNGYEEPGLKDLFGFKGAFGLFFYDDNDYSEGYETDIFKFDILKNGEVTYNSNTKIEGKTINQYSLDEQNGHLRIALYDNDGARVAIFDDKLNQIGISSYVAKGETMYSSRFMGNKVYLVTYQTIDPLFVIDLSNESKPKVLGELKIPGYSTYLHPYDENHLIGIGMQTQETITKDSRGAVTSRTAKIVGMKMALFDVSNVNKPKQISETVIGDRRTTSAILTNPKALLFSREKELIAIPVNNYAEDFEVTGSTSSYSSLVSSYTSYSKPRTAEGYFVYKINLKDGFDLKGVITHEVKEKNTTYSYYYNASKLLRGMYIDNNLYTVSETAVKVNNLDTLDLVSELKIKE